MAEAHPHEPADVDRARVAVAGAFATNGLALATVISRTPAIRDGLGLSPAQLGLLLLCLSFGAVAILPVSGPVVHRLGPGRSVLTAALSVTAGLVTLSASLLTGVVGGAAVGLVLSGLGIGLWDVAMNVEGADVERRLGRAFMPRLHAAFSVGNVLGAGVSVTGAATGTPLAVQMLAVAVLLPVVAFGCTRGFLPVPAGSGTRRRKGSGVLRAWREPRTLAIGVLVFAFAFTEGTATDWIAVALVDGHGANETIGATAFGLFVGAMTLSRLMGVRLLDRFGRVVALRATTVLALTGVAIVLFGGSAPLALVGAVLWGAGVALGFPVGMSAAADDPELAAARVSVASSVGYTAFLAGPPLIGLLAEHAGILRALLVVTVALVLGLLASSASRPLAESRPEMALATGEPGSRTG